MIPTPQQLSQSLIDLARGYEAEIVGTMPDPALGNHIKTMAKRLADRIRADDQRLAAFAPFTDVAGYVWMPATLHGYWKRAEREFYSFERWLTELAQMLDHHTPLIPSGIAELEREGGLVDQLRERGYRPIAGDEHGLILKRDPRATTTGGDE